MADSSDDNEDDSVGDLGSVLKVYKGVLSGEGDGILRLWVGHAPQEENYRIEIQTLGRLHGIWNPRSLSMLCQHFLHSGNAEVLSYVTVLDLRFWGGGLFLSKEDGALLFHALGVSLPNLRLLEIDLKKTAPWNHQTASSTFLPGWTNLFREWGAETGKGSSHQPVLKSFACNGSGAIQGTVAEFQAWADSIRHGTKLSSFECRVGDEGEEGDNDEDDEDDPGDEDDDVVDAMDAMDGEGTILDSASENDLQPIMLPFGKRIYHSTRHRDFEINKCWDPVIYSLASNNKDSLKKILLLASWHWAENTLLTSETTQALLSVANLTWPLAGTYDSGGAHPPNKAHFPFTLNLSDRCVGTGDTTHGTTSNETPIDIVVDYLLRVHKESGVVTHFVPENPLARTSTNASVAVGIEDPTAGSNTSGTFLQSLVRTHGLQLPTFRFMYNGREDPGRTDDIFVHLSASLVQPARLKARLTERLQPQPVRVAEELLHEPKHLIFYQGIQEHDLWTFDPVTATDGQFLDMLAVMASLGPHGSFFHKSVDYGMVMRYNLLSAHRDRLIRWVDGMTK